MGLTNFITNRERTFWLLQTLGWTGYFLVRFLNGYTTGLAEYDYPIYTSATVAGFCITVFLRYVFRQIRVQALAWVMGSVVIICIVFGLIMSSIELSIGASASFVEGPLIGLERFSNAMFETTVLLAWSALYFGYYYYSQFNLQRERALKALAMAHQAQLKMLRYQLNPHFLFNTLNAISTLVLEKAVDEANEMLTKLSSFLRYTLHNQPTHRVTMDQELHALSLYLDIEKVRFQERLNIDYDIDEGARKARVPSLIMQPLVENAIKYAVAPALDGGEIRCCAKVVGNRLEMALKDDGPGIEDTSHIVSKTGSGVGLANTKERLQQIYGDDHTFDVRNLDEGGLGIFINIPLEFSSEQTRRLPYGEDD